MITDRLPKDKLILCAVSGGVDSMYLLCRLREMGYAVAAAHYNHALRGEESDRDEAFVSGYCRENNIPFVSEKGDVTAYAAENGLCVEDAARRLRYDFLHRAADTLKAAVIATAHNAGDNAETVLMNATRGTGLRGLCGIPPVRGRIVRPMLDVTKQEAAAWLGERGIPHVEDSTNAEDTVTRNRIRHRVMPVLEQINPSLAPTVGRMTELLRRDEEYLSGLAEAFVRDEAKENTISAEKLCELPWSVASRAVRCMAGRELSLSHTEAILQVAEKGGFADVTGMRVGRCGKMLVFGTEEKPSIGEYVLKPGSCIRLKSAQMTVVCTEMETIPEGVHRDLTIFYFSCANICGNITVTPRRPGDCFRPVGRGVTKSLKQLFMEKNIPSWERDAVPVVRDEKGILAVFGIGAAERACALPGQKKIIEIKFIRDTTDEGGCIHA